MDKSCSTAKKIAAKVALVCGRQKCESWLKLYSPVSSGAITEKLQPEQRLETNNGETNVLGIRACVSLRETPPLLAFVGVEVVAGNKLDQHSRVHFV
jgi:hypothetical protein